MLYNNKCKEPTVCTIWRMIYMAVFKGIDITTESAKLSSSRILAEFNNDYADRGTVYIDKLRDKLEAGIEPGSETYKEISSLFTLIAMNYQVCNGGVMQYYDNGYDSGRRAYNEQDCDIYNKEQISEIFQNDIADMVSAIYSKDSETYHKFKELQCLWNNVEYIDSETEDCFECGGSGEYNGFYGDYTEDSDDYETSDICCPECGGSGIIETDSYITGAESFEDCLYNFDEYDTILEMYAEYIYKKNFELC